MRTSLLWQFQTQSDKPKLLDWIRSPIKSLPLISTGPAICPLHLLSWIVNTNLTRWVLLLPPDRREAWILAFLWWPCHRICWDPISIEPGWGCFCGIKLSQEKKGYLLCTSQYQNFSLNSCGPDPTHDLVVRADVGGHFFIKRVSLHIERHTENRITFPTFCYLWFPDGWYSMNGSSTSRSTEVA